MMHGAEKSGLVIVAGKPANKAEQPAPEGSAAMLNAAEPVERRAGTKGNADQQSTRRTQSRVSVSQALERIRQVARERRKERFTGLFHHIGIELLAEAFCELKADAAPGVDQLTWKDYEADLGRNLEVGSDRVRSVRISGPTPVGLPPWHRCRRNYLDDTATGGLSVQRLRCHCGPPLQDSDSLHATLQISDRRKSVSNDKWQSS